MPSYVLVCSLERESKILFGVEEFTKKNTVRANVCTEVQSWPAWKVEQKETVQVGNILSFDIVSIKFYPNWERAQPVNYAT